MATFSTAFPSLLPRVADDLWFKLEKRLDDDAALAKEEEEYAASVCSFDLAFKFSSFVVSLTSNREHWETFSFYIAR